MEAFKNTVQNRSFATNIHFSLASILTDFLPILDDTKHLCGIGDAFNI